MDGQNGRDIQYQDNKLSSYSIPSLYQNVYSLLKSAILKRSILSFTVALKIVEGRCTLYHTPRKVLSVTLGIVGMFRLIVVCLKEKKEEDLYSASGKGRGW